MLQQSPSTGYGVNCIIQVAELCPCKSYREASFPMVCTEGFDKCSRNAAELWALRKKVVADC